MIKFKWYRMFMVKFSGARSFVRESSVGNNTYVLVRGRITGSFKTDMFENGLEEEFVGKPWWR